jgi:hypothetical protein
MPQLRPRDIFGWAGSTIRTLLAPAGTFFSIENVRFRYSGMAIFYQHLFDDVLDFFYRRYTAGCRGLFEDSDNLLAEKFSCLSVSSSDCYRGAVDCICDTLGSEWDDSAGAFLNELYV